MSLLLDALKRAEQAKQNAAKPAEPETTIVPEELLTEDIHQDEPLLTEQNEPPASTGVPGENSTLSLEPREHPPQNKNTSVQKSSADALSLEPAETDLPPTSNKTNEQHNNLLDGFEEPVSEPKQQTFSSKAPVKMLPEKNRPNTHRVSDDKNINNNERQDVSTSKTSVDQVEVQAQTRINQQQRAQRIISIQKTSARKTVVYVFIGVLSLVVMIGGFVYFTMLSEPQFGLNAPPPQSAYTDGNEEPIQEQVIDKDDDSLVIDVEDKRLPEREKTVEPVLQKPVIAQKTLAHSQIQPKDATGKTNITKPQATKPTATEKSLPALPEINKPLASKMTQVPIKTKELSLPPLVPKTNVPIVSVKHAPDEDPLHTALQAGYEAYQQRDLASARMAYLQALKLDQNNRDTHLGLAGIAQLQNQFDLARSHYKKVLDTNPKDSVAMSGLISLSSSETANLNESQVKILLKQHPEAAYLHFNLGNLYVAQKRWADAQQAFFKAHHYDPLNADYAYNLAVSLDHMSEYSVAIQYYSTAVALNKTANAAFDNDMAKRRIDMLKAKSVQGE